MDCILVGLANNRMCFDVPSDFSKSTLHYTSSLVERVLYKILASRNVESKRLRIICLESLKMFVLVHKYAQQKRKRYDFRNEKMY